MNHEEITQNLKKIRTYLGARNPDLEECIRILTVSCQDVADECQAIRTRTPLTSIRDPKARTLFNGNCYDCGKCSCMYMVHDELWQKAWPEYRELRAELVPKYSFRIFLCLCLECLEVRIKRPLLISDFTPAPINDGIRIGYTLGKKEQVTNG